MDERKTWQELQVNGEDWHLSIHLHGQGLHWSMRLAEVFTLEDE